MRMTKDHQDRCELLCLDLPKAEALRQRRLDPDRALAQAAAARALGDPTRLTITAALAEVDELCVCDLAWVVRRDEKLVSHHVRALREAGLVTSRRERKMVLYQLTAAGRELLQAVLQPVGASA
jgi:ArsR family transcriptional regulator, lead/cadmium/zinc/bismuth-responsive transcriptional repressor